MLLRANHEEANQDENEIPQDGGISGPASGIAAETDQLDAIPHNNEEEEDQVENEHRHETKGAPMAMPSRAVQVQFAQAYCGALTTNLIRGNLPDL